MLFCIRLLLAMRWTFYEFEVIGLVKTGLEG